ncbi:MAG: hypothetical protein ACRBHB_10590 [Arenicella sp.]
MIIGRLLKIVVAVLVIPYSNPAFSTEQAQTQSKGDNKNFGIVDESTLTKQNNHSTHKCEREHRSDEWLDKLQANTHSNLCRTVRWFDGLFGDEETFDSKNFSGKVVLGFKDSERDGFDPKLRIRIKSKLPNVSTRFNAFIGRVDEDSYISDSRSSADNIADRGINASNEDPEWLIGLGYSKEVDRGFDYSIGAKISSGLNPYAKIRYRHLVDLGEKQYLKLAQTLFWRRDDGYGTTTNIDYSHVLGKKDILGWASSGKFTEKSDQWESISGLTWYHRFKDKKAIASRIFVRDEEKNPVSYQEYGLSLTYRQPLFRRWFFIEAAIENKWIRDEVGQPRDSSFQFGLQAEMVFGKHYENRRL